MVTSAVPSSRDDAAERPLRLVAVTHGAPSGANREAIMRLADGVASERPGLDVAISFVDARAGDLAGDLLGGGGPAPVIVPLVLSAGFHVRTGLALGLERLGTGAGLAEALGPDDRIVEVLARRLRLAGLEPDDAVVLAAAGSNDPRAVRECFETARRLGHRLGRSVTVGFIAAAIPRLPDAVEMIREVHPGVRIAIAPYLLAPGTFSDAAAAADAELVAEPLLMPGEPAPAELVALVLDRHRGAEAADRVAV